LARRAGDIAFDQYWSAEITSAPARVESAW
jgi:hypothetical protein